MSIIEYFQCLKMSLLLPTYIHVHEYMYMCTCTWQYCIQKSCQEGAKMVFAEIKGVNPPSMCVSTWPSRGVWGMLPRKSLILDSPSSLLVIKDIC